MLTLKFKYEFLNEEDKQSFCIFQKQFNSLFNICYNYIFEHKDLSKFSLQKKDSELTQVISKLNHIETLDFFTRQCAIDDAFSVVHTKETDKKIIFGGKTLFSKRQRNLISKEEFLEKRLRPIYLIGRADLNGGNQKFKLQEDLKTINVNLGKTFNNFQIKLKRMHQNRQNILSRIYLACLNHQLPITYSMNLNYVYITFDDKVLFKDDFNYLTKFNNRVMSIDLNPNYIGWSIVDWTSSSDFKVINEGVISIKDLNDKIDSLKTASSDPFKKHLSNIREHETYEITKALINKALYYKVNIFGYEDLKIKSKDNEKGKHFNKLVNNYWLRTKLIENLEKRCALYKITLQAINPAWSSIIGNFLYRSLVLPDMVLSAIEIGRRSYEFVNQYKTKKNKIQKNIIFPNIEDFKRFYMKSLEELNIPLKFNDWSKLCKLLKKSEQLLRLSLDQFVDLKFSRLKSQSSYIKCVEQIKQF